VRAEGAGIVPISHRSGLYYDLDHTGEGFAVEILDDNRAASCGCPILFLPSN
jgi:hypothetical protein